MRTDRGFLLAEEMLSWLHNNKVISPFVEEIERTLAKATTLADRAIFSALTAQLEPRQKAALDRLLVSEEEQPSRLAWLLQHPGKCPATYRSKDVCFFEPWVSKGLI